ncbi:Cu/Pi carrier [Coemansia sp. RSA 1853]|nr:Cu/Pi carrier [Coemansia sp. RSA 1853]
MIPPTESLNAIKAVRKPFIAASTVEKPFVAHAPIEINSAKYFYTSAVGGALACGLTHYMMTPVDMLKCRMQVTKGMYSGVIDGFKKVASAEGIKGLYLGGMPTLIGYSLQGMGKYGFYEYFKYLYTGIVGEETAAKYKTMLYLSASGSAEVIADVLLCPMEALKVKMQTSATPFATSFLGGLRKINAAEGINGFYKGLAPLWLRQIPYTMVKFATFERTVEAIYKYALSKPKEQYSKTEQLGLNNVAKAEGESTGTVAMRILKDLGFTGVWAGLGPRIFMIGTLTAGQWLVVDSYKVWSGLPTTGGAAPAAKKE